MQTITLVFILAAWVWLGWEHRKPSRALRRRSPPVPPPTRDPSLTVIGSIFGLDAGARKNVEALLANDERRVGWRGRDDQLDAAAHLGHS